MEFVLSRKKIDLLISVCSIRIVVMGICSIRIHLQKHLKVEKDMRHRN